MRLIHICTWRAGLLRLNSALLGFQALETAAGFPRALWAGIPGTRPHPSLLPLPHWIAWSSHLVHNLAPPTHGNTSRRFQPLCAQPARGRDILFRLWCFPGLPLFWALPSCLLELPNFIKKCKSLWRKCGYQQDLDSNAGSAYRQLQKQPSPRLYQVSRSYTCAIQTLKLCLMPSII